MPENKKDNNYLILPVQGGAGKNVLATAVVKAIKKYYGDDYKIIILTGYKDIWLYNTNVHRVFLHGQCPYFYTDYVKDKNVKIVSVEPYTTEDYILKKKHLIEIWCDLAGAKYNNEQPELFFNQRELEYFQRRFFDGRKIMLIQTNGGMQQDVKISWMRDMPLDVAQEVINRFSQQYRVIHIRRDDQPSLNVESVSTNNFRELMGLIKLSEKRLFIDSVCHHVASALKKESTVLWVRNNPEILGYAIHDNIITKVEDEIDTTSNSVFEPYNITGNIYECPFKEGTKLFDTEEVIMSVMRQKTNTVNLNGHSKEKEEAEVKAENKVEVKEEEKVS